MSPYCAYPEPLAKTYIMVYVCTEATDTKLHPKHQQGDGKIRIHCTNQRDETPVRCEKCGLSMGSTSIGWNVKCHLSKKTMSIDLMTLLPNSWGLVPLAVTVEAPISPFCCRARCWTTAPPSRVPSMVAWLSNERLYGSLFQVALVHSSAPASLDRPRRVEREASIAGIQRYCYYTR